MRAVVTWPKLTRPCRSESSASYLGHLDNVGKLCQAGDGDHIMIGFHLVPGKSIKHLRATSWDATFLRINSV